MEKLKTFLNDYFWLLAIIGLAVIAALTFLIYGTYQEKAFERGIEQNRSEASQSVTEAQNANSNAANFAVERRVEDSVREKIIAPKVEAARRRSQNSKVELQKAKEKYENEKVIHPPVSSSRTDNCRKLKELYPGLKFEYCDLNP